MILNKTYYQTLWDKFQNVQTLSIDSLDNSVDLSVKIILEHYRKNKSIHINFQSSKEPILAVARQLFVELANDIYLNHYDLPSEFKIGDRLKRIKDKKYYIISGISNGTYTINKIDNNTEITTDYEKLLKGYVKVEAGVRDSTIKNYIKFFEELNNEKSDFLKLNFEVKNVFITKKPLWDFLNERKKVPSIYLPNPNDGNEVHPIRSIQALPDCINYFTPKYDICYQQLLQKGEKIKTIVIFDTETDKLNQIMKDQFKYKFNVLVLSNSNAPTKSQLIPCWNWFKEELEIIDAL